MNERIAIPGIPDGVMRQLDDVPMALSHSVRYSPIGEVAGGVLLLRAAGTGRYLIYDGSVIDFTVEAAANPLAVDRFLWGNAFSGLLHQRREFPLHAAGALSPDGTRVIALCGPSGAGKSTLAATFVRQGWRFFADDLVRISADNDAVLAWPGRAVMRLCADACERLSIDRSMAVYDSDGREKFIIATRSAIGPAPLAAIVALGGEEALPRLELLAGGAALVALTSNVSGPRKLRALGRLKEHFMLTQRLLARCPIFRLHGRHTASAEVLSRVIADTLG
jgi:hypothetical protein